jgi:hypothetical protein
MIAIVCGVVYYFYTGVQAKMDEIQADEAKRLASQNPIQKKDQGLSRSEQDQRRSGTYGDAVKNSESIQQHNEHIKETEKAMQDASK